MKGIAQQKSVNPYVKNPAEMMSDQAGINVRGLGDTVVTEIDKGDWVKVSSVNFSKGASQICFDSIFKIRLCGEDLHRLSHRKGCRIRRNSSRR